MTMSAYPLSWPSGWKRTLPAYRTEARFGKARQRYGDRYVAPRALTVTEGLERVLSELQRMGIDKQDVIVSTNVPTRLDGFPRAGAAEPMDPGAAVYWQEHGGARRVMAIDLYDRVADNLAAIAATLDAMRAIERHGGAAVLERAFTGFVALPSPTAQKHWRDVLGVMAAAPNAEQLRAAYRFAASAAHPDRDGGSDARMAEVNVAYDTARKELGL